MKKYEEVCFRAENPDRTAFALFRQGTVIVNTRKAVTLVELLIVVMILAALAAIAIPRITATAYSAKEHACGSNIDIMNTQIELWAAVNGSYPATLAAITGDTDYFPDGPPVCSLGGTYSLNANDRVVCNH